MTPADQNLAHLDEIFNGSLPDHLKVAVIQDAQHLFCIVDSPCMMYQDHPSGSLSDDLVIELHNWLTEVGY